MGGPPLFNPKTNSVIDTSGPDQLKVIHKRLAISTLIGEFNKSSL